MIRQTLVETETGPEVLATFVLPGFIWADAIYLVGDFNEWNETSHRFSQDRSENWVLTVRLRPNRAYACSYIRDGQWFVDGHADGYVGGVGGRILFLLMTDLDSLRSTRRPAVAAPIPELTAS
jgi:hypothetical protein